MNIVLPGIPLLWPVRGVLGMVEEGGVPRLDFYQWEFNLEYMAHPTLILTSGIEIKRKKAGHVANADPLVPFSYCTFLAKSFSSINSGNHLCFSMPIFNQ